MSTADQRFSAHVPQPAPPYAMSHPVFPPPFRPLTPWSTGLCHSGKCSLCIVTCLVPCVIFGRIAEIVDQGSMSCIAHATLYTLVDWMTGCVCLYAGSYRGKIRMQYGLEASPCNDYCTHCCCHKCALRQEYRELELRGFDLSTGWNGNIKRKTREAQLAQAAPTIQAGMYR